MPKPHDTLTSAIGRWFGAYAGRGTPSATMGTETEYRRIVDSVDDVVFATDGDACFTLLSPPWETLTGRPVAASIGCPCWEFLHPDDVGPARARMVAAFAERRERASFEGRVRGAGNAWRWVETRMRLVWTDGRVTSSYGMIADIATRKAAEEALHESELRFQAVVERSPEPIVVHADGEVLFANPAALAMAERPRDHAIAGTPIVELLHPDDRARAARRLAALAAGVVDEAPTHYRLLLGDSRTRDVQVVSVPVMYAGRSALQTHLRDITEHRELQQQLQHQALHDPLTGLANRTLFRDRTQHALARSGRRPHQPAVLFFDVDNFKGINDGLGHVAGDLLLSEVASRLTNLLRSADTVARIGADEFAVLLEDAGDAVDINAHAAQVAQRVIDAFRTPIRLGATEVVVGVSVGIATPSTGDDAEMLLRNADLALHRAKLAGKGCYQVFQPAMHEAVRRRLELENELRRAVDTLEGGGFVLHYQPIVVLETGRIAGFEALVRWLHPERGLVPPGEFIGIAEDTGLIVPLGRWVLREACRQARIWQRAFPPRAGEAALSITVNVSGRHFARPELALDVADALERSGLPAKYLVLEITESMLVDDSEATLSRMHALTALGVRLAIDDFGTGYSSLGYLERFPVNLLKIDKSFVDKVGLATNESPLAGAILGLGGALGMRVVAEGIETMAQWTRLRELGCELGQGFHFARPLGVVAAESALDVGFLPLMPDGASGPSPRAAHVGVVH